MCAYKSICSNNYSDKRLKDSYVQIIQMISDFGEDSEVHNTHTTLSILQNIHSQIKLTIIKHHYPIVTVKLT